MTAGPLREELRAMTSRIRELERALKPFADIGLVRDNPRCGLHADMLDAPDLSITPRHVRTARIVLGRLP
jgi:hypothetical protein